MCSSDLATEPEIQVKLVSYGEARVRTGYMGEAPVPAAQRALKDAGLGMSDVKAVKTHNPFAAHDVYFSREMGISVEEMNHYGSSLIFGHPQAPTGTRLIIELIEELTLLGGGVGLFSGCAAGDTAAAVVVEVS